MLPPAEGSWCRVWGGGALGGVDGAAGTRGALPAERPWALPLPRLSLSQAVWSQESVLTSLGH